MRKSMPWSLRRSRRSFQSRLISSGKGCGAPACAAVAQATKVATSHPRLSFIAILPISVLAAMLVRVNERYLDGMVDSAILYKPIVQHAGWAISREHAAR